MAIALSDVHSLQDIWQIFAHPVDHAKLFGAAFLLAIGRPQTTNATNASLASIPSPTRTIPPIAEADKCEWAETQSMVYRVK